MRESLSEFWARDSHRALSSSTTMEKKLALAMTPIRSVIRVVDDHVPPMTVEYAAERNGRSVSATDFANGIIIINPLPITEEKLPISKALDVVTGFAMHEAGHGKHSRDRYKYLIKPGGVSGSLSAKDEPAFRPMRIAAYLWNLVEDVRIESCVARDWPGFGPYFDAVLGYMWMSIKAPPIDADNPHPALSKQLQEVYLACRYPDRASGDEVEWWKAWQDDYLTERADTPATIQRGLDHLSLDPETKKEMEALESEERKEEAAGERAQRQLDRLMREGVKGTVLVCINENGDMEVLDAGTSEGVDQLVREGLIEIRPVLMANGASNPPLFVRKPEETKESRRLYTGKPDAEASALRTALVFRQATPQYDVKLLRSGTMDDEELYRWGLGDHRVFSERVIESKPDAYMGLLVDLSGSMDDGYKLDQAQKLAQLFVWALHDKEGVETQVWGHSGDGYGVSSVDISRLWERGDPMSRLGLISTIEHRNNYDGHALAYVVRQVLDQPQPQKLVIVLSDGLPSGNGYGGVRGMNHVQEVAEWSRRQGCDVIQIAIASDLRLDEQAKMYGAENVIGFTETSALPRQLAKIMARYA